MLQKEAISAERTSFCRNSFFLQKDRKIISYQKVFLPNFWQKFHRKTLSVDHNWVVPQKYKSQIMILFEGIDYLLIMKINYDGRKEP